WIDGWILPLIPGPWKPDVLVRQWFGPEATIPVRGVGVVVFLVFTVIVGWLAKGFIGRKTLTWAEGLVDRMPVVRSIYNGLKQIAETVFSQNEASFERACLVEYPKENIWAIGFVSTRAKGELQVKLNHHGFMDVISVFLPTTPNPTSGFLLYVPAKDVIYLDMTVEDAAKLIISAGLVYPNGKDQPGVAVRNPSAK
ncbi:MAG: DUF502 domain-containing protein, partial [Rhodobacteraceae bacterium]|nr:DUF502 domain-containing protein [Paracoccaceae bacterium]